MSSPRPRRFGALTALPLLLALGPACADPEPAEEQVRCNGHAELCDRPLNQVAFAGTHNSMSNQDADWKVPNQHHGIQDQLQDGVRAFLIDTTLDDDGQPALCHGYCSLGSTPLAEALGWYQDFLDQNPGEILIFIIQDDLSVDATVAAFEQSGLSERVITPDEAGWPTLGELVEQDRRLLVSAEVAGPPPDWYHHAWDLFWDTPYAFDSIDAMNCDLNRGDPTNPLFLVNHWVGDLANAEAAAEANAAEVLGARASACQREWGHVPNVLAVDFYDEGDLFEVVDQLNGL